MTTHCKDVKSIKHLDQITCKDCREKVGIELLGDGMLCTRGCGNLKTLELHSCPFSEDINDNYESECQCCPDCENECAMDI